ncbi:MAG: WD40 repeat domain-containing protein [Spirulina sp. SIO3F2]|nr:WD40 repeat domain-containing protein [Spirulina sp. SIO3F2]
MAKNKKPFYHLKRVFNDGRPDTSKIVPISQPPWKARMNRRSLLGVGVCTGTALAVMLGKQSSKNGSHSIASELHENSGKAHKNRIWELLITSDDQTLISGSSDGLIKYWSLEEGALFKSFEAHKTGVLSLALSPDNQAIASGSTNGLIKIWDFSDAKLRKSWQAHDRNVHDLDIALDNKTILSAGLDGTIRFWDLSTGQLIHTLDVFEDSVFSFDLSPDNRFLAAGSTTGVVKIYEFQRPNQLNDSDKANKSSNWKEVKLIKTVEISSTPKPVDVLKFSPDSKTLAAAGENGTITIIEDIDSEITIRILDEPERTSTVFYQNVFSLQFSLENKLFTGDSAGKIKIWNLVESVLEKTIEYTQETAVYSLVISSDGKVLGAADGNGNLTIRKPPTATEVTELVDLDASLPGTEVVRYERRTATGELIIYTVPVGSSIPAEATCVCNSVSVESPPEEPAPSSGSGDSSSSDDSIYCGCVPVYYEF